LLLQSLLCFLSDLGFLCLAYINENRFCDLGFLEFGISRFSLLITVYRYCCLEFGISLQFVIWNLGFLAYINESTNYMWIWDFVLFVSNQFSEVLTDLYCLFEHLMIILFVLHMFFIFQIKGIKHKVC
jgi:hypothetical protein